MFPTYNSLAEVPEAFREHYVMRSGKAVPEVSTDHPLVTNNATLKTQKEEAERAKAAADTAKTNAERDATEAKDALSKANVLQSGQRAVSKADFELIEAVKAEGLDTVDKVKTLKAEHGTYKATAEEVQAAKHAADVGDAMGWDKDKTARTATRHYDFSTLEVRDGADGKRTVIAKIKQADGTTVEKPFADVVKATPDLSDLVPLLTASGSSGTRVPGSTGNSGRPLDNDKPLSDTTMKGWGPKKAAAA